MVVLTFGKSEKRWLNGWKNAISLRMYLDTRMASSILLWFKSGPSISSCSVSRFHLVWSFVIMTYAHTRAIHR